MGIVINKNRQHIVIDNVELVGLKEILQNHKFLMEQNPDFFPDDYDFQLEIVKYWLDKFKPSFNQAKINLDNGFRESDCPLRVVY
ncbi:hypothetical protein CMI37_32930 [Candidatus Pacearchaeota archaeon]|nr:hypothetical protein [Candidatus Pacearchaeota archaeon]|tara:strand:- start:2490 stop:2744 length:255 start_codon:yes stop_codon:yes gene_type:complete